MEEALGRLRSLTPVQLRQEILAAGLKCGPITSTTRAIFERKLARSLLERNGGAPDGADGESSTDKEEEAGHDSSLKPSLSSEEGKGEEVAAPCGEAEESPSQSPPVYYGVCPQQDESSGTDKVHVFVDRKKALRAMGNMKGARFKAFSTREGAEEFSKGASECSLSPVSTPDGPQRTMGLLEFIGTPPNSEKANEFHSPRPQDLAGKLRKSIEHGDQEAFATLVWANPRYLIGSGDNPTIVHEGCHYNVLHVAARENQAGMAQVLLDTLESPEFMRLMYPEDQEAMLHQRIRYLVDLYLNTPDRTNNDTPLHFACKFGCAEVVNVLCSHPTTDRQRRNKYSQKPSSVICERKNKTPEMRRKIKEYLENRCYVPLLRDTDNSFQPVIGLPWSPSPLEVNLQPLGSGLEGCPIDPVLTVRAYVGPLSPSKAEEFYRLWRTPPRERAEYFHRILKSDPDRGVERVGREIAHDMGHPWAEYWDFLGDFVDLSTEEGLIRLEEYLDRKYNSVTPQHNNRLEDRKDNSVTPQHNNRLEDRKDNSVTPQHNNRLEDRKDNSVTPQHNNRLEDRKDNSVTPQHNNRLEDRKDNSVTPQHNNRLEDRKDNSVTPQHNNRLEDRKDNSVTPQHNNRLEDRKDNSVTPQHNNRLEDRKDNSVTPQHNNSSPNRGTVPAAASPQRPSSPKAERESSGSLVCNLLPEFEKASFLDVSLREQRAAKNTDVCLASSGTGPGGKGLDLANGSFWRMWGWRQKQGKQKQEHKQNEEELSSCSSEDYRTADEGSECCDRPGEDGRDRKDSTSSYSSCQSTGDTAEDTTLIQEPSASNGLFIEGASPSRLDREVLSAVENIAIDPERFSCIAKWRSTVEAYPSPLRLRWPSPVQKKSSTETRGLWPSRLTSPWHPRSGGLLSPLSLSHTQGTSTSHSLCTTLFKSPKR